MPEGTTTYSEEEKLYAKNLTGNKNMLQRVICLTLIFMLLSMIFGTSAQDGEKSSSLSSAVALMVNNCLNKMRLDVSVSEFFVRKAAHFTEYLLLGLLLLLGSRTFAVRARSYISWLLFLGLLVPVLDEFSQAFVPGRVSSAADVVLDFFGVLCGLWIAVRLTRGTSSETGA